MKMVTKILFCMLSVSLFAGSALAQTVVFDDDFVGSSGSGLDTTKWTVVVSTSPAPSLDGSSHALITSTAGTWNDPRMQSTFKFGAFGANEWQIDWKIANAPDGPSITWLGIRNATNNDGSKWRGFMLHPAGTMKIYTDQTGTGLAIGGSGVVSDFTQPPSGTPFTLRMVLRSNGAIEYSADIGGGFVPVNPTTNDSDGNPVTQADVDRLKVYDVAGGFQYDVGVNPNGCCGAAPEILLDRITVTRIGAAATDTPTPTPTPSPTPLQTPPAGAKNALFVVNTAGDASGDNVVQAHLESLGYTVTVVDEDVCQTADANQKNVVLISSSVNSGMVTNKYAFFAPGVITWEPGTWDDMQLTRTSAAPDAGNGTGRDIEIINASHPLAAGKTGTISVSSNDGLPRWGNPSAAATGKILVAGLPGASNQYSIFAYDTGGMMENGHVAQGRRVGFFLDDAPLAAGLSADGQALLTAAVNWAALPSGGVNPTPTANPTTTPAPTDTGKPNGIGQSWYLYE